MKKFVEIFSHPLLHLFIGLLLFLLIGFGIEYLGVAFDPVSAWFGAFAVIAMDIFDYGVHFFYRKNSS